jgi:putative heme-binding domain-containing protein
LLGKMASGSRASALERFLPSLNLTGSVAAGQKTFVARCASCHRLGGEGFSLGPDLASVRANGKEKLLTSILDPNREVAPQFASYTIETRDGESMAGIIASESATAVLLRQANGVEKETARKNIVTMQGQGQSLMPEGLEEGLSAQDMADLLEFIVATP